MDRIELKQVLECLIGSYKKQLKKEKQAARIAKIISQGNIIMPNFFISDEMLEIGDMLCDMYTQGRAEGGFSWWSEYNFTSPARAFFRGVEYKIFNLDSFLLWLDAIKDDKQVAQRVF